jgi:ABC-2 type transport system permease protein
MASFGIALPAKGAPLTKKAALKLAGAASLAILVCVDIGTLFVMYNLGLYDALKPARLEGMLLLNAATLGSLILFAFGFIGALSTYSQQAMDQILSALPVKPREILGAKFAMIYLSELAFSVFFIGIAMAVFAIREKPPAMFYLNGAATILALPLLPLALVYCILIPLLGAVRLFKNKNVLVILAGFIGAGLALGLNIGIQSVMMKLGDGEWLRGHFAGPESMISLVASVWPPARLAWNSISAPDSLWGIASAIANLGGGFLAAAAAVWILGPAYAKSLSYFGESHLRKNASGREYFRKSFRSGSPDAALFLREWRLMNREPVYFLNGPFIILGMPLVMAVMAIVQKSALAELGAALGDFASGPKAFLAVAAFGGFLGTSTSIACTALSRDAKVLPWIRTLPLEISRYMMGKLAHALSYALIGAVFGCVGGGLILGLTVLDIALAFATAMAFSSFMNLAGLALDTAFPKLRWDNPVAALKQNLNAVIMILGSMGALGLSGLLGAWLPLGKGGLALLFAGGFGLAFFAGLHFFPSFAERRIGKLES